MLTQEHIAITQIDGVYYGLRPLCARDLSIKHLDPKPTHLPKQVQYKGKLVAADRLTEISPGMALDFGLNNQEYKNIQRAINVQNP